MLFSENWLRELVNPPLSRDELIHQLTMAGLEIDGFEAAANEFNDVVVGQVQSVEKHPDADKLSVCQVIVAEGGEPLQIVCGASNVRPGLKVPVAMIGAKLAKDFKIKKSKLRGVESNGMLCAEEELGLAESSDGLMELAEEAPLGADIRDYLGLDDSIIEVDLTPNRGDCLSILGLARDVAALNDLKIFEESVRAAEVNDDTLKQVELKASDACPRYVGRVIKGVNVKAATPIWMTEKLRRSGIRSIDPVVDVTNYVLLELGQPMHAFDLSKLEGDIQVRFAAADEKLTLLNEQELTLRDDSLVISDEKKALALAGIMGGLDSSVTEATQDIFLESAFFSQLAIAGKARSYGLHTDSSHRFERGVDFELQEKAIERATQLLLEIVGGQAGPLVHAVSENDLPKNDDVNLRKARLARMLGVEIGPARVTQILTGLGFGVEENEEGWKVSVPSYRFDIAIEADLIEEVGRVYGYNELPEMALDFPQKLAAKSELQVDKAMFLYKLASLGYRESICYSFIDEKAQALFAPGQDTLALANPISAELAVMRTSMWPGLAKAALFNQNRQQHELKLFEHGLVFQKEGDELVQTSMLAGLVSQKALPTNWDQGQGSLDFYDVKADIESLFALGNAELRCEVAEHPALHPGQSAKLIKEGREIGLLGALHPKIIKDLGLNADTFVFEIDFGALRTKQLARYEGISKFPGTSRDIALIVDQNVPAQALLDTVYQENSEILSGIRIFDLYEGDNIEAGKKSIAINLAFQHQDRTLEELEVTDFVDKMAKKLEQSFEAKLRD